jgi:hypothetical protein
MMGWDAAPLYNENRKDRERPYPMSRDDPTCAVGTLIISFEQESAVLDLLDGHGVQREPVQRNRNGMFPTAPREPRCLGILDRKAGVLDWGTGVVQLNDWMRPGTVLRHDHVICRAGRTIVKGDTPATKRLHLDPMRF